MLLEGAPILMHTIRKFAALPLGDRNRGRAARRRYGVGARL